MIVGRTGLEVAERSRNTSGNNHFDMHLNILDTFYMHLNTLNTYDMHLNTFDKHLSTLNTFYMQ